MAEISETDEDSLKALLKELDGKIDLDLTGFDEDSLDDLLDRLDTTEGDNNTTTPPPVNPITKPGDLYELGNHRLLCGDSTNAEDVRRVMNGERAILFATDPPYLVGYDGTNHPGTRPKTNTDWSETYGPSWDEADAEQNNDLYDRFIKAAIAEAIDPHATWYCWHASRRQRMVEDAWEKNGAFVHQQIIWAKPNRPILTRSWFLWAHEPCFMGWIKGNKPPRESSDYERSVWEIEGLNADERPDHPTPKPLECFAVPMRQHTKKGGLCFEPFSGSGSQLIAGEQLGRRVYGLEISPAYCDVIVRRWLALDEGHRVPEAIRTYVTGFAGIVAVVSGGTFASQAKDKCVTGGNVRNDQTLPPPIPALDDPIHQAPTRQITPLIVAALLPLFALSGCAWVQTHRTQIDDTLAVVGQRALSVAERVLISVATDEADKNFKADFLDSVATGLRQNETTIVNSDDVSKIVQIWSPNDGAAWQQLAGSLSTVAGNALQSAGQTQSAAIVENIAVGLNDAAAKARATTTPAQ